MARLSREDKLSSLECCFPGARWIRTEHMEGSQLNVRLQRRRKHAHILIQITLIHFLDMSKNSKKKKSLFLLFACV